MNASPLKSSTEAQLSSEPAMLANVNKMELASTIGFNARVT